MPALAEQMVLKEGDIFLLSHDTGDVDGEAGLGLYYRDTRYLSLFTFLVNGHPPPLLNATSAQNFMGTLQLANDIYQLPDGNVVLPQTISIRRSRFIIGGLHERIGFTNYNRFPVPISVTLLFGSDFRDIFDVRGFYRDRWGELLPPRWEDGQLALKYMGLDGLERTTDITFDRQPDKVSVQMPSNPNPVIEPGIMVPVVGAPSFHITIEPPVATLTWHFVLEPHEPTHLALHVVPRAGGESDRQPGDLPLIEGAGQPPPPPLPPLTDTDARFDKAVNYMRFSYWNWETQSSRFSTDHDEFNALLKRSQVDLRVLSAPDGDGYFPSAGIPWFTCPFGRDSLVTALQTLALNPQVAIGTLRTLARYQGTREDTWREEQPGKILHELRLGEMARLGMVPHSPYYGSIDSTPLFVLLFVEAMRWLECTDRGDARDGHGEHTQRTPPPGAKLYDELLPNVMRAVQWIDKYGDLDGDGFIEYRATTSHGGIRNQVWKDSDDSMQFPDGTKAETPVAAVEVQAYVYAARQGLSELLRRKGDARTADKLASQAAKLKKRFNKAFWMPEAGFFTQGLDKDKRQVPTITSNPGHCLWCGIVDDDKAGAIVQRMMQPDMNSGWGIRTISDQSPSYNPMSYHNGSIWPHDNSLIVAGFKRYGYHDEANEVIHQIAEAARFFRYSRLPELYCGFSRDKVYYSGPAEYPVSCNPQAWAAASTILMLQTILGLHADAHESRIRISPRLPDWMSSVRVSNLRLGDKRIDLAVERRNDHNEVHLSGGDTGVAMEIT